MKKIFIGYVLAALAFTINMANGCALVLPPSFVGVLVMVWGCKELKDHNNRFGFAAVVGCLVAVLQAVEWFTMLLGLLPEYIGLINAVLPLVRLLFDFLWVFGVCDLEKTYGAYLYGAGLRVLWVLQFVLQGLVLLGLLSPLLIFFSMVGVLLGVVLNVVFLVMLYRSWKAYERVQLILSLRANEQR